MRIVLIVFLVAFYLLVFTFTPVIGQSILNEASPSMSSMNSGNMFSIMFGLFSGGFNPALTQLSIVLWAFNVLAVIVFVLALKGG